MILNANNNVYTNWTDAWAGDVIVDGDTIDPGAYPDTDLGDEAVGIARFTLHQQACVPAGGATITSPPANDEFLLWHYGPVQPFDAFWTPSLPMVSVARATIGSDTWTTVTGEFDSFFDANNPRVLKVRRVSGSWGTDVKYRMFHTVGGMGSVPVTGYLECMEVAGNPSLLAYQYEVTLGH